MTKYLLYGKTIESILRQINWECHGTKCVGEFKNDVLYDFSDIEGCVFELGKEDKSKTIKDVLVDWMRQNLNSFGVMPYAESYSGHIITEHVHTGNMEETFINLLRSCVQTNKFSHGALEEMQKILGVDAIKMTPPGD